MMMACQTNQNTIDTLDAGVSSALAEQRANQLEDVRYQLFFNIPDSLTVDIPASLELRFSLKDTKQPVILDFKVDSSHILGIRGEERAVDYRFEKGHIVIPTDDLKVGENNFKIKFIAGDLSLNRSEEYLYTLFVPDRAATAFPCFDQPDIKARYSLQLEVPAAWSAVGNGPLERKLERSNRNVFIFKESAPISTYLFAFAAGLLRSESRVRNGRNMTMYFRETDDEKVAANVEAIFDLHASAITWLENYTGIPYPFEKFDFALFPTFQYGGMEHVGAVFYRESSLFLDESATDNQKLGRASLIAHETAHMWFGDLVTMQWFNDVWLKEVFANFMAAKIVNPSFPDINHQLRFLLAHQPAAYGEDRSGGSHPIQQKLENLKDAGTLYGRIIYQKAPVVMRQLEALTGEDVFQEGLQEYLRSFSFGNATWDDLIGIFDKKTAQDLKTWSQVWVKEAGMPIFQSSLNSANGTTNIDIQQGMQAKSGAYWPEYTELILFTPDSMIRLPVQMLGASTSLTLPSGISENTTYLLNGSDMSYGYFTLTPESQAFLLANLASIADPLVRGAGWMALYEECIRHQVPAKTLFTSLMGALPSEQEPLNRQNMLSYLGTIFWQFFSAEERQMVAPELESILWDQLLAAKDVSAKSAYFQGFQDIALSTGATEQLYAVWSGALPIVGLPFSESNRIDLACELALRLPDKASAILAQQLDDIKNPDRRKRLAFIRPALSADQGTRDAFFESLKLAENRHYEPWVASALAYLHHPLRASEAEKYILPSLELMEEIQTTGDIFFPRQWVTATLSGHQSATAAKIVQQFLAERPNYPYRLRNKILMGADMLLRNQAVAD